MRNLGVVLFYTAVAVAGILLFLSIRWFVLNGNPVFYESTNKKIMTPEEVKLAGMPFEADKRYYHVEKRKTYLRSGRFPFIEKEVLLTSELEVLADRDETGSLSSPR
jgi:hypothetical protein